MREPQPLLPACLPIDRSDRPLASSIDGSIRCLVCVVSQCDCVAPLSPCRLSTIHAHHRLSPYTYTYTIHTSHPYTTPPQTHRPTAQRKPSHFNVGHRGAARARRGDRGGDAAAAQQGGPVAGGADARDAEEGAQAEKGAGGYMDNMRVRVRCLGLGVGWVGWLNMGLCPSVGVDSGSGSESIYLPYTHTLPSPSCHNHPTPTIYTTQTLRPTPPTPHPHPIQKTHTHKPFHTPPNTTNKNNKRHQKRWRRRWPSWRRPSRSGMRRSCCASRPSPAGGRVEGEGKRRRGVGTIYCRGFAADFFGAVGVGVGRRGRVFFGLFFVGRGIMGARTRML